MHISIYLILALTLFVASVGVSTHVHTCKMTGTTRILPIEPVFCLGNEDTPDACCFSNCDYENFGAENVLPDHSEFEKIQTGLQWVFAALPREQVITVEIPDSPQRFLYRPPPLPANREILSRYAILRI